MKKLLIIITIILSILFGKNVYADDGIYYDKGFKFVFEDGANLRIIGYCGLEEDIVVPSNLYVYKFNKSYSVKTIAKGTFVDCVANTITISKTIKNIEEGVFSEDQNYQFFNYADKYVYVFNGTNDYYEDVINYENSIKNKDDFGFIKIKVVLVPSKECGYILTSNAQEYMDDTFFVSYGESPAIMACENPGYTFSHWEHNLKSIKTQNFVIDNAGIDDEGIYYAYYLADDLPSDEIDEVDIDCDDETNTLIKNQNNNEIENKTKTIRPFLIIGLIVMIAGSIAYEKYIQKKYDEDEL